jgi:hypothetical protein
MSNQERADQLARELDRLLAGERAAEGDPLLEIANRLAGNAPDSPQPSAQAVARFEQQLERWFGPSSPPTPLRRPIIPAIVIILVVAVIVILVVVSILGSAPVPLPLTPTTTVTATTAPTSQPTFSPIVPPILPPTQPPSTASPSTTIAHTLIPTVPTATTIPYVRVVVEGSVQSVDTQTNVIVVRGQTIRLHADDPLRLRIKVGNWVRITGNLTRDGERVIIIAVVTVIMDTPAPVNAPGSSGGQGGQGGSGGSDDDDDD